MSRLEDGSSFQSSTRGETDDKSAKRSLPSKVGRASMEPNRSIGGGAWNRTDVLLTAFVRRLVGESNPSHPIDSGAATPIASRARKGAGRDSSNHARATPPRALKAKSFLALVSRCAPSRLAQGARAATFSAHPRGT